MLKNNFQLFKKIIFKFFPFYKNKDLKLVFKILNKGFSKDIIVARFVGGCVRKHLLGENIDDIDIATILTTDEIKKKFENTKFQVIDSGIKHGTVTLVSKKLQIEITTLRKDTKTDGRHAEIEYTDSWQLDSERRDFTINAIYLDINGNIFDPQMGTIDLSNNNVKFIGDPQKRIEEDYLRIIRFIRFKLTYNDKVEATTLEAIKINLDGVKKISKERILIELFKILDLDNFIKLNENFKLKEIFTHIFPEFIYLDRLKRLKLLKTKFKIDRDVLLAILLIDDKDNHEYFGHKYRVSNLIRGKLNLFAKNLKLSQNDKNFLKKDLYKNIYLFGKEHILAIIILNFVNIKKNKFEIFLSLQKKINQFKIPKFKFDGKYLLQNGMKEGLALGKVLKTVEEEWINNNFKITKDKVTELIKQNQN